MTIPASGSLSRLFVGSLACLAMTVAATSGCTSQKRTSGGSGTSTSASSSSSTRAGTVNTTDSARDFDANYAVGPTAARSIGYRVLWNTQVVGSASDLIDATVSGDSVFVVDSSNNLTRIMRDSGSEAWNWPIGEQNDNVLGVRRASWRGTEVLVALTEGDVHIFDVSNGIQLDRQELGHRVAATAPVVYADTLIYGSVNGQVIWHNFGVNAFMRGNTLFGGISAPLAVHPAGLVVAVSETGHIMGLGGQSGEGLWSANAREAIRAQAAITNQAVFVTSEDQFIRCLDAGNGELLWRHLHASPLTSPPIAVDDRVYIDTPDMGLVCYEAVPYDDLDGNILWNNEEIAGTVIGRHGGNLLVWDADSRTLSIVEQGRGDLVDSVTLPNAVRLMADTFESGDIYAVGSRGHITRLSPRN